MYQGAKNTSKSGNGTSSNPGKKRRRRPAKKKKNPSPVTWILIAGAGAAAVGGSIAYAMHRKKKKSQLPGQPGGGTLPPSGGGGTTGGGGSSNKTDAPAFPYTTEEAKAVEFAWAQAEVAEEQAAGQPISLDAADDITDDAFYRVFPEMQGKKIPAKKNRGSGWQPYVDSWLRIRAHVKSMIEAWNSGLAGG